MTNPDVIEKKKLEAQFLRAQRLETIGALAGGIAHDLNNLLAPILIGIDLLREELPRETRQNMLNTMRASAQRGSELIKQILSFARGVSGEPSALDLKHILLELNKLARETFPRSIQTQVSIPPNLSPVLGDATQLHQALLNLWVNARDAMPGGGLLQVDAQNVVLNQKVTHWQSEPVSGSYVVLTVSDTGQGMAPEVLARIFEPFFTTKGPGKGTGLGLSTVQGIVKSHGGFLEVSSQVGKGTAFKLYLPAVEKSDIDAKNWRRTSLPAGHQEQILVIDDEIAMLEMIRETLEAFNYRILTAKNGAEALALYQQHKGEVHAVISDMMMPVMDGPTTIRALQKTDPSVKVIGISGLGSESALIEAGKLEVQEFLKKPFTTERLLTALRQLLMNPGGS